jgi:tetratricopeptide (TPR) repeat protein
LCLPGHPPTSALYSALGRVYLQIGDVQLAQHAFNSAADLRDVSITVDAVASLTDAGLVAIAQNAFTEALGYFQQALTLQPDNPVVKFRVENNDNIKIFVYFDIITIIYSFICFSLFFSFELDGTACQ